MISTFRCSLLIVLTVVEFLGSNNVSGIVLYKKNGNVLNLEEQDDGLRCTLPSFPENGQWRIINGEGGPGEKIHEDTFLKFHCHPGFDLTPKYPYVFCDTNWNHEIMPKCLRSTIDHNISGINSTGEDIKRLKRQSDGFKCTLPPFPENGRWTIVNGDGRPGDEVEINTGMKFQCHPRHELSPKHPYWICDRSWSLDSIPKCLKMCSPLYSTPTTSLQCKDATGNAISCSEATDGTYLTFQCIPYYEALGRRYSLYCREGSWDFPKPVCQPVCGKKVNHEVRPLVIGGDDTNKLEYPWITAVYIKNNGKLINNCGGTLLNPRIVLTAAHCVTNTYGNAIPEDDIEIGAGKYFNQYGDTRDIHAQYSKVARVIVHEEFRGDTRRFQYDIALIVTKTQLTLGPVVQPACYSNIDNIYPHVGSVGELAGWGITEDGNASDNLRRIRIPYKEKITCTQELPSEWSDRYNFDDKLCAGFHKQNKSVCPGDSGSGLVFLNPEDNRFYVHGIVSISPKMVNGFCNNQDNTLFTKVSHYYEWLDKQGSTNYDEECILPSFPKHGKWEIEGNESLPGDRVSFASILIYSCRKGYKLSTPTSKFVCGSSLVPPTCELLCPLLKFPNSTVSKCTNKQNEIIDCDDAVDGTSISYTCPQGYGPIGGQSGTGQCSGGYWGSNRPKCTRKQKPEDVDVDLVNNKVELPTTIPTVETTTTAKPTVEYTSDVKVMCTYASWRSYRGINPEDFDPSLCTHFIYAYSGITDKGDLIMGDHWLAVRLYPKATNLKKKNKNLKVLLSVGGSGASNTTLFSGMAADAGKTATFIKSAGNMMKTYDFDGLDIDWFYPKIADKENYITFLRKVKDAFDKKGWLLSVSVRYDANGTGYDPPKMSEILDWITVKSYDMYGPRRSHNPAFPSIEFEWEKDHLDLDAVAENWIKAGISKSKLVVSVAFYGRRFPLKGSDEHSIYSLVSGNRPVEDGLVRYSETCSKLFDHTIDSYKSKEAVSIKGEYIKSKGLYGVNVWPVDADDVHGQCGTKQVLLRFLHEGLGNRVNLDN